MGLYCVTVVDSVFKNKYFSKIKSTRSNLIVNKQYWAAILGSRWGQKLALWILQIYSFNALKKYHIYRCNKYYNQKDEVFNIPIESRNKQSHRTETADQYYSKFSDSEKKIVVYTCICLQY